uniref:Putative cytochrome c oxidase subunit 6b n=1 Tax=Panstrongylus lignarius TaxID=156445 RepID=A0A224XUB2_9HEMI
MVKIEIDGMICEKIEDEKVEVEVIDEGPADCPVDPRFQQQNKTKWCYVMFIDFHRCAHYLGPNHKHCKMFEKCYKILCPKPWIATWEEQIENGTFPRDLTKEMGR